MKIANLQFAICNLHLRRRSGAWWICGFPDGEEDQGPYATKAEAAETRDGLEESYKWLPLIDTAAGRRYFTSLGKPKKSDHENTKARRAQRNDWETIIRG